MISCEQARAAVSARLDGVDALWASERVTEHIDGCAGCRDWEAGAIAAHQRRRAPSRPLGGSRAAPEQPVLSRADGLRYVLGAVACTELILGLGSLVLGQDLHPFRELVGADIAFAFGCLVAAVQPRRSLGVMPVAVALGLLIVGTGILDLVRGVARPLGESHHLLELAGSIALVLLARRARRTPMAA